MQISPIKTRPLLPPQDDLLSVIDTLNLELTERCVVAVTAKVVAIHQGRSIAIADDDETAKEQKRALAREQSQWYLERDEHVPFPRVFTIYEGTLGSTAGIDASNSNGYFTLLPKNSSEFARELRDRLRAQYDVRDLGVIITDSRGFPMRNGTIGVTIGYAGFKALYDYRGSVDIFDRPFKAERINVADTLASTAILAMGEGNECTPVAVIKDIPHIEFADSDVAHDPYLTLKVPMDQDVFAQFYQHHPWQPGGRYNEPE